MIYTHRVPGGRETARYVSQLTVQCTIKASPLSIYGKMAKPRAIQNIHWKTPIVIIVAFFSALALALGHHAFYQHLDGKYPEAVMTLFPQHINIAIGTGFALLFRSSLVVAVGSVYWQAFWATMLQAGSSIRISDLDSLAGMLGSLLEFSNLHVLKRNPGLVLLALLYWLLPLTALFPPGTLSVVRINQVVHSTQLAPALNLSSEALFQKGITPGGNPMVLGPGPLLLRLATSTALQSYVPQTSAIATQSSYVSQFLGPAMQCRSISTKRLQAFREYMKNDCRGYEWTREASNYTLCGLDNAFFFTYIAWDGIPPRSCRQILTTS